jgi:ribosomal protein S21|tara:strand:+ start:830 stop:1168 length:339 start_codon:yes stop_codon:yes gene_type:complete
LRGSSSKPRQKFQVRNFEPRKHFKKKPKVENKGGLSVTVHGDDINKALRIFKKKVLKAGILNETHERQFFTKRSEKLRLAKSAGRQRWLRKMAETPGPHQHAKNYRKRKGQR